MNATKLTIGDCILHADHHEMQQECWRPLVQFFLEGALAGQDNEEVRQAYKLSYERRLLDLLVAPSVQVVA